MSDLTPDRLARLRDRLGGGVSHPVCGCGYARVSPALVIALIDEIQRLTDLLGPLVDAGPPTGINDDCEACGSTWPGHYDDCAWRLAKDALAAPRAETTTTIGSGDIAIELPVPPDKVIDLMEALERSMSAAKEAREDG